MTVEMSFVVVESKETRERVMEKMEREPALSNIEDECASGVREEEI